MVRDAWEVVDKVDLSENEIIDFGLNLRDEDLQDIDGDPVMAVAAGLQGTVKGLKVNGKLMAMWGIIGFTVWALARKDFPKKYWGLGRKLLKECIDEVKPLYISNQTIHSNWARHATFLLGLGFDVVNESETHLQFGMKVCADP